MQSGRESTSDLAPASETSRHGFLAVRNGHDGQVIATHLRTSSDEPAQSRHFARIASTGDIGA